MIHSFLACPLAAAFTLLVAAAPGARAQDLDLAPMVQPVPVSAVFRDPGFHIWDGSMIRDDAGKYHLFYSRWSAELPMSAWASHSAIAHAVGDTPIGPFRFKDVALPPRGKEYWDGMVTHNPSVTRFRDGKYYLYYMGNTGDGVVGKSLNWTHRNNQRIGVAVADHPDGPWRRFDKPVLDISEDPGAPDALMVSNPTVTQRPDGGFLMMYKGVAKQKPMPSGGPVTFLIARGDSPTGPFTKDLKPMFSKKDWGVAAEDPFIWTGKDRYWGIVRIDGHPLVTKEGVAFKPTNSSFVLVESMNGSDWKPAKHPLVTTKDLQWKGGDGPPMITIQRPCLVLEEGQPEALVCISTGFGDARDLGFIIPIPMRGESCRTDGKADAPLLRPTLGETPHPQTRP